MAWAAGDYALCLGGLGEPLNWRSLSIETPNLEDWAIRPAKVLQVRRVVRPQFTRLEYLVLCGVAEYEWDARCFVKVSGPVPDGVR